MHMINDKGEAVYYNYVHKNNKDYWVVQGIGSPEDSFGLIAQLWTAYMGTLFTSKDVAMLMALLKVARIKAGDKADSFVDLAGYAACAGEIATAER